MKTMLILVALLCVAGVASAQEMQWGSEGTSDTNPTTSIYGPINAAPAYPSAPIYVPVPAAPSYPNIYGQPSGGAPPDIYNSPGNTMTGRGTPDFSGERH